jgi:hypothetical protein
MILGFSMQEAAMTDKMQKPTLEECRLKVH